MSNVPVTCSSHNWSNLLKRTVTVHMDEFIPQGNKKFHDLETFLASGDKVVKNSGLEIKTLNLFLTNSELDENERERIAKLRHPDFSDYDEDKQKRIMLATKQLPRLRKTPETRFRYISESAKQVLMAKTKLQELENEDHELHDLLDSPVDFSYCEALHEFCKPIIQMIDHFESETASALSDILPALEFVLCVCADLNKADRSEKAEILRALKKAFTKAICEQIFNEVIIIYFNVFLK